MGFVALLAQWVVQGLVIFAAGLLPLTITSQPLLAWLTIFGTGRLITSALITFFGSVVFGAASTLSVPGVSEMGIWPAASAISHIAGVLFMLVAERRVSSRVLDASPTAESDSDSISSPAAETHDDAMELRERHQTEDMGTHVPHASRMTRPSGPHQRRIYLFTFAFVAGEIVTGISVGCGAMGTPWQPDSATDDKIMRFLPGPVMVSVLALFSQGATVLGFATMLLSASLPIAECKRHVLLYAAAQPLAALVSYNVTMLSGFVPAQQRTLIIVINSFTGGLFVYAVLVVRTLVTNSQITAKSGLLARVVLMAAGAILPYVLPMLVSAYHFSRFKKLNPDNVEVA